MSTRPRAEKLADQIEARIAGCEEQLSTEAQFMNQKEQQLIKREINTLRWVQERMASLGVHPPPPSPAAQEAELAAHYRLGGKKKPTVVKVPCQRCREPTREDELFASPTVDGEYCQACAEELGKVMPPEELDSEPELVPLEIPDDWPPKRKKV